MGRNEGDDPWGQSTIIGAYSDDRALGLGPERKGQVLASLSSRKWPCLVVTEMVTGEGRRETLTKSVSF